MSSTDCAIYSILRQGYRQRSILFPFLWQFKYEINETFLSAKDLGTLCRLLHCRKSSLNFRDITLNVVENIILHEIFCVVSGLSRYISCYIAENGFPLGQCTLLSPLHHMLRVGTKIFSRNFPTKNGNIIWENTKTNLIVSPLQTVCSR